MRALHLSLLATLVPTLAAAQPTATLVAMVGTETGEPLPYGTVALPALAREQLTDDRGAVRLTRLPPGSLRVVVRRIGYAPRDTVLVLSADRVDTLRVRLRRVTTSLATARVADSRECTSPGPPDSLADPASAAMFEQLRQNADQLCLFNERYPLTYASERTQGMYERRGKVRIEHTDTLTATGTPAEGYRRGQVVRATDDATRRDRGAAYVLAIPTLLDVAGDEFQSSHCFVYGGVERVDGVPYARVRFRPARAIRTPDVEGAFYLDTATYRIRRMELAVTRVDEHLPAFSSVRAVTVFREVVPSVPIYEEVRGESLFATPPRGARGALGSVEIQRLLSVHVDFLGEHR